MNFEKILENLRSPINIWEAILAIGFSLAASIVVYLMYQLFYSSRHIGAGVHRSFIIGGPAITTLFLGIQSSIPLSLGLLGALSFVRFRTPVKDPAEIGFILLLIASSIGAATHNYLVTVLLFGLVFAALATRRLMKNQFRFGSMSHLMIVVDQESYAGIESQLSEYLGKELQGLRLETVSMLENRVTLRYLYRRKRDFDGAAFSSELSRLVKPAKLETFVG